MSNIDIIDFLKKQPLEWFTAREISEGIKVGFRSTCTCLRKMRKYKMINFDIDPSTRPVTYIYQHKRFQ